MDKNKYKIYVSEPIWPHVFIIIIINIIIIIIIIIILRRPSWTLE